MIKPFLAAVGFLTICPLPAQASTGERDLGRSTPYFPVVGVMIGGVAAGLDFGLRYVLPLPVASVLVVIFLLAASGGLHLDGLADTADGFFSSRPRERILEIMRDSRTGPMGVIAIVCVLMLKVALLAAVPQALRPWVLLMMPLAGRAALLINMAVMPYARPEGGLATIFYAGRSKWHPVWALMMMAAVGWFAGGWAGLIAGLLTFVFALLFAAYVYRRIGGATGDTLGAACELSELVPALVCIIAVQRGLVGL